MNENVPLIVSALFIGCLTYACSDATDPADNGDEPAGGGAGNTSGTTQGTGGRGNRRATGGTGGDQSSPATGGSSAESGATGGSSSVIPVDVGQASCDGLITDTRAHAMTTLAKPSRLDAAIDPEFGTRIVRVTDVASETGGEVIKPVYSTIQAWSADESYLMLYEVGSGHRLYDGHTYEFIRRLNIDPPDLEQVYWDPLEPDLMYVVEGNKLTEYSVSQNSKRVVHTFSWCRNVSAGEDPMYISWDGNAFGLLCDDTGQAFVYHRDTDSESQRVDDADLGPQVGPSGTTVYLVGDVYDGDMNFLRTLDLDDPYNHASLGQLANGHDTFNGVVFDPGRQAEGVGTLVVFDMTTGQDTVIVGEDTGYPYPPSGTHVSAVAHHAPGWVAVSVVGNVNGRGVLDNELLLANTNTGEVCRIGHHRSYGKAGPQDYWAEPHATISPSGTRVLFASDWGGGSTVDTYVVELPSYGHS